jgi:Tfp pilus assembly protein PilO
MNKLSKEKRDKLILVCIAVVAVLGILYTFVLGAQKDSLAALETKITGAQAKLAKAEASLRAADSIEATLNENKKHIEARQDKMAPPGQYYYWFLKLVDQFRKDEKLDSGFIVDITQPEFVDAGLMPKFPYKGASFGLRLNGQFHEIGKFIAALENTFPYFRVQNIKLSPSKAAAPAPGAQTAPTGLGVNPLASPMEPLVPETKLVAELKIITLIKPGNI